MKTTLTTLLLMVFVAQGAKMYDFEESVLGETPAGFFTALTGDGGAVSWVVREESGAPSGRKVLAQTSNNDTDKRFPLCVLDGFSAKDVTVSVKFKTVSGKVDQAGGIMLRYKDADNYYVLRANALENNVRLYKVVKGNRKQFAGANVKVVAGQWHDLNLEAKGNHFKASFNDKVLFEADDDTFPDAGKTGLWTKADSVTLFDDFTVTSEDSK